MIYNYLKFTVTTGSKYILQLTVKLFYKSLTIFLTTSGKEGAMESKSDVRSDSLNSKICKSLSNYSLGMAKKHVFGSISGCRGGKLPNSCLRVGSHGILTDIILLAVMCRASVSPV
jgi:hypothetical protein